LQQSAAVESQAAHFVESQQAAQVSQQALVSQQVSVSHGAASSVHLLPQQAQDAAAIIAATIAKDINTFFIILKFRLLIKNYLIQI
jgi:hypothetical protein